MIVPDLLLNPTRNQHIALIYENDEELQSAIARYLNEGLTEGQFCVYATVHYRDAGYIEKFSRLIKGFEQHVQNGDLLIVDLAPLYVSALMGDIKPFDEAKKMFTERAAKRDIKHVRFVGDGTGFLFKNKHFDVCTMVEKWWQEKPFDGSYVCPYSREFLETFPRSIHAKRAVVETHDVLVKAPEGIVYNQSMPQETQESNSEKTTLDSGGKLD